MGRFADGQMGRWADEQIGRLNLAGNLTVHSADPIPSIVRRSPFDSLSAGLAKCVGRADVAALRVRERMEKQVAAT